MSTPNDPLQPVLPTAPKPAGAQAAGVSSPVVLPEDAGTQALSEALQSSFRIIKVLMVFLVVVFLWSGVTSVKPNEIGIKLRFGRPLGAGPDQILKPGLHWALPNPIDEIVTVPVGQSHSVKSTAGWYAVSPDQAVTGARPDARPSLTPLADGYTLTADGSIIHVRATVKYRIVDPIRYAFHFANVSNLLQNLVDNSLFYVSAQFTADAALYKEKDRFKEVTLARVNELIAQQALGIALEPSEVETEAPLFVAQAFVQVQGAEADRSKKISEAQGQAEELKRKAEGEARVVVSAGEGAARRLVESVNAEAKYFTTQLDYYRQNPKLFRERLLTERMARVLTNAQDKFFLPERADGQPRELRLLLTREPLKPKAQPGEAPATP